MSTRVQKLPQLRRWQRSRDLPRMYYLCQTGIVVLNQSWQWHVTLVRFSTQRVASFQDTQKSFAVGMLNCTDFCGNIVSWQERNIILKRVIWRFQIYNFAVLRKHFRISRNSLFLLSSRNLNISQNKLYIWNLQITRFKMIYDMLMF